MRSRRIGWLPPLAWLTMALGGCAADDTSFNAVAWNLTPDLVGQEARREDRDPSMMGEVLRHPNVLLGASDSGAHVAFTANYGYSTYLLGHWVREEGLLSLEEGVRRLTFDQACVFGFQDRGLLRTGWAADMMVFDPETIRDKATYFEPFQYSEGITHVLVNGRLVVDAGKPTEVKPGRVLSRQRGRARPKG